MNLTLLQHLLTVEEGLRLKPYRDTVGKLTIGIGRNLDDVGISEAEALLLLGNDVTRTTAALDKALPWWRSLDDVRSTVVADLAFNMGVATLQTFRNTLGAIQAHDYAAAADGLAASKWHRQVGGRAIVLEGMMRSGRAP